MAQVRGNSTFGDIEAVGRRHCPAADEFFNRHLRRRIAPEVPAFIGRAISSKAGNDAERAAVSAVLPVAEHDCPSDSRASPLTPMIWLKSAGGQDCRLRARSHWLHDFVEIEGRRAVRLE